MLKTFLKELEGFNPQPYDDYQQVSIGHGSKYKEGIHPVPMSRAYADTLLQQLINTNYTPSAKMAVENRGLSWSNFSPHQKAAIVSFCYNLGPGTISSASWPQHMLNGDMVSARTSWLAHYNAGGSPLEGLVRRRFQEWQLFTTGSWTANPPGWRAYWNSL